MLESPSIELSLLLGVTTLIGISSLLLSEIADILKGNKPLFLTNNDSQRIKTLRVLLADNNLDETTFKFATDELDSIAYKYSTGIKASKIIQEKIISFVESSQNNLTYSDFKKVLPLLYISEYDDLLIRKAGLWNYLTALYWITIIMLSLCFIPYLLFNLTVFQLSSPQLVQTLFVFLIQTIIILGSTYKISKFISILKISKTLNKLVF